MRAVAGPREQYQRRPIASPIQYFYLHTNVSHHEPRRVRGRITPYIRRLRGYDTDQTNDCYCDSDNHMDSDPKSC